MEQTLYKIEYIKKKIEKYEYVSFDIFDTLIKRNVAHYRDIFTLTCNEYEKSTGKKIKCDYVQKRIEAEQKAREQRQDKEPNLDDIFNSMEIKEDKDLLKQIEVEQEIAICQQNKDFYEIYTYCKKIRKKIIITSDMYLNKEYIEVILKKNGIDKYDYLFISNEEKLNKHTGKIYPSILKKLGIKPNQMIHIGDSKRGDYLMPKRYGINSILIPKKINKLNYYNEKEKNEFYYQIIESFINNNIPQNKDKYFKIGYEILGILLYGYSKWLLNELKKEKINKVIFLAREGALLKRAFDELNNNNIKKEQTDTKKQYIESKYLYVSRRSTRVALLKNIKKLEDIFEIVKMRRIIDLSSFFINIGLDIKKYQKILEKYNCNENTNIKEIPEFEKLFNEIKQDIIENAKKEEKILIEYLKQQGFQGKIAICDVGWIGTMQHSLEKIAQNNNLEVDIIGYYMGQADKAKEFIEQGMKSKAYLFEYNTDEYIKVRAFLNLFESFFLAQHGTTKKYEIKNSIAKPILAECEYSNEELEIFKNIQEGAMQFIKDFSEFDRYEIKIEPQMAWKSFKQLGLNPTLKDVKLFGNISYVETKKVQFANPNNIFYYIIHPKKMYYDFCNCSWKIGFLKRLFKVKLDYFKLYKIMLSK